AEGERRGADAGDYGGQREVRGNRDGHSVQSGAAKERRRIDVGHGAGHINTPDNAVRVESVGSNAGDWKIQPTGVGNRHRTARAVIGGYYESMTVGIQGIGELAPRQGGNHRYETKNC